jgi:anti-sigma regulatory factor (Ser/Thr protein kinase)
LRIPQARDDNAAFMMRDIPSSAFSRTFSETPPPQKAVAEDDARDEPMPSVSLGKLSVPVDLAYLRPVQSLTSDIAGMLSYDENDITRLQLAVEEAFTNAVQHFSRTPGAEESIHVEFASDGRNFTISIRDRGIPFEIDEVDNYASSDAPDADRPGLGLTLMKNSVDKVEMISAGHDGKEVRLTKALPVGAILPECVVRAGSADPAKNRRALDIDEVTVRFPESDDLPSVRRLAWRCNGYNGASLFYDIGKLKEMLASRLYLPVIAVDAESGEAVYHVALKLDKTDDAVPLEGMEFADPNAQCEGLPRKATLILHEIAKRRGFKGVRINAAAGSLAAQKNAVDLLGASPCALLMAHASVASADAEMLASGRSKNSAIVHYSPMDLAPATVYIPERHADMAAEIYKWLGLKRTVENGRESPIPMSSEIECSTNPDSKYSVIRVKSIGMDSVEKIHDRMNALRKDGTDVISVWLAADSPFTPDVAKWCEKVGLSFAGLIPSYFGGRDALVMQWVGVPLDMSAIRIYGDKGRKLFAYVKNCLGY